MFHSPSPLPDTARTRIAEALDACLADGLDLHGQLKVAHWNLKGPHFAVFHPLFETFAVALAARNDDLAERAVTLGGRVHGTARQVARKSRLEEYPQDVTRDLEHVRLLAGRIERCLEGFRAARAVAGEQRDAETVDLLTQVVGELEKNAWVLWASLEGYTLHADP